MGEKKKNLILNESLDPIPNYSNYGGQRNMLNDTTEMQSESSRFRELYRTSNPFPSIDKLQMIKEKFEIKGDLRDLSVTMY